MNQPTNKLAGHQVLWVNEPLLLTQAGFTETDSHINP
jgi:hypothetical protein